MKIHYGIKYPIGKPGGNWGNALTLCGRTVPTAQIANFNKPIKNYKALTCKICRSKIRGV